MIRKLLVVAALIGVINAQGLIAKGKAKLEEIETMVRDNAAKLTIKTPDSFSGGRQDMVKATQMVKVRSEKTLLGIKGLRSTNVSAKKMFKVGDEIKCVISDIDKEKKRVAISHRLAKENPYKILEKKFPVGSMIEGIAGSINEYAIYVKLQDFEIDGFLHANDISYTGNPGEEIKKFKKGDKLKVKILEIKVDQKGYQYIKNIL